MIEERNDSFKEYTEPVTIVVSGKHRLTWIPGQSRLASGPGPERDIAIFVNDYIRAKSNDEPHIMITPEGPSLPASCKSIYTVVWAMLSVYEPGEVVFIGDAPTLGDMGL